ncbi:MAG: DUF3137 domain-containing protein [Planctomycetes bacterium]|nr:DUF3137 domain-containing protein [Planctomycetota bacterium]
MGLFGLFGPSKEQIWSQVAHQVGGTFHDGGFFGRSRLDASHGEWTITLDTYTKSSGNNQTTTYTRFRAPFVNADGFNFTIYRTGLFSGIGKMLGFQDIEVGFPQFDDSFVIKGNSPAKLRRLFSNATLRDLLQRQPAVHFEVRNDEGWFGTTFPDGVDELYFQVTGVIRDPQLLRLVFDLFTETLEQLCRIGSAYEDDPGVHL